VIQDILSIGESPARLVMSLKPRAHVQLHSKMSADQKFNHLWEPEMRNQNHG